MAVAIHDKNKFITEASKLAMHALIGATKVSQRDPQGIAQQAREYAKQLWLAMRVEV